MSAESAAYPVVYQAAEAAPQNRLSVLLRIIFAIPHLIITYFLQIAMGVILLIAWFVILFTGSYPGGMLTFSQGGLRWMTRVNGYLFLLTDKYPPFGFDDDAEYPIRLSIEDRIENRNRLTTFWPIRFIMAIPHFIVLYILAIVAVVILIIAWFVALFTGSVPAGMHNFLAGFSRWYARVMAYVYDLIDEYPPFSLN